MRKDLIPLIIGIILPIAFIAYVAAATYIPSVMAKPRYSFLYTDAINYGYSDEQDTIEVQSGKVVLIKQPKVIPLSGNTSAPLNFSSTTPHIYLYDPVKDSSKMISVDEAQQYTIDTSDKSPDGYKVERAMNDGGIFPFYGGGYRDGYVLTGHGLNRPIPNATYYNMQFLGWITQ